MYYSSHPYRPAWGCHGEPTRDEVQILIDGKDAHLNAWAWCLHQAHAARRCCGCGSCARCMSPATLWFDATRAQINIWQDYWRMLFQQTIPCGMPNSCVPPFFGGAVPCSPTPCPPETRELVLKAKKGSKASGSFEIRNHGCDTIRVEEGQMLVDGFQNNGEPKSHLVTKALEISVDHGARTLCPGESVRVTLNIDTSHFNKDTYLGAVILKTPFLKRVAVRLVVE